MSEPVSAPWLKGQRVSVLVWNGFTHDARVLRESRSLAREGAMVKVICLSGGSEQLVTERRDDGVEVERINKSTWLSRALGKLSSSLATLAEEITGSIAMAAAVVRSEPDLIHGNDVNTLIPAWLGARLKRVRFVYDAHEISADREGYRGRVALVKVLERYLGGAADAWMSTTGLRTRWFEENYGYKKGFVVQNRPSISRISSDIIRKRLCVPEDEVIFLYQGGLQPGRGLRNLVRASAGTHGLCLVMVGDGRMKSELVDLARSIDAPVHFVGQVALEELPLWTASADVGMQVLRNTCLNHFTTDSNKLFEYAMGGLAVIASDFPEIRAVVEEYELGSLIDPENVDEIRAVMQSFAEDASLLLSLKSNARRSREVLDWYSQEPMFFSAYGQALATQGRLPEQASEKE